MVLHFSPCFFRSGRWSRCAARWLCSSQSLQKTVSSQSLSVCANCLWLVASPVHTKYPQLRKTHFHCHNTHECTFFLLKEPLLSQPPAALGGSCCRSLRDRESCVHLNLFLLSEGESQSVSTKNSFAKWFILRLFLHPQFGPSALFYSLKKKKMLPQISEQQSLSRSLLLFIYFFFKLRLHREMKSDPRLKVEANRVKISQRQDWFALFFKVHRKHFWLQIVF